MLFYVYENKIGFPMKLNEIFSFETSREAVLFARARAQSYEDEGLTVDRFNGHDWIWFAVNYEKEGDADKGIMLQIFNATELGGAIT